MIWIASIATLLFLVLPWPGFAKTFSHPKLGANALKKTSVHTVLIVPPRGRDLRTGFRGTTEKLDRAEEWKAELSRRVATVLRKNGFEVQRTQLVQDPQAADSTLAYTLSNLQVRYDRLAVQLLKKPQDVEKGRYSLGDDVLNGLPEPLPDGLVFIRAQRESGFMYSESLCHITIVHAMSGDVLFHMATRNDGIEWELNGLRSAGFQPETPPPVVPALAGRPATAYLLAGDIHVLYGISPKPTVYCDEAPVAKLARGEYFAFRVESGSHRLRALDDQSSVDVDLAPGVDHFFQVDVTITKMGRYRAVIRPLEPERARSLMNLMKPIDSKLVVDSKRVVHPSR